MGIIILFVFLSILFVFLLGMVFTEMCENNDNNTSIWFTVLTFIFCINLGSFYSCNTGVLREKRIFINQI